MRYETVIDPPEARDHIGDESWLFVDCRFFIREPERAERDYEGAHVARSVFAHLDRDLSGPITRGVTGRHPLPSTGVFAATAGRLGIGPKTQVVAYDESTGAMAAARLWWLLKWAGHDAVAVLDGGLSRWSSLGFPIAAGRELRAAASFEARFRPEMAFNADQVLAVLRDPSFVVLDARLEERYHGMNETIDPVAGHIDGAFCASYTGNLRADGCFRSSRELADRYEKLTGGRDADHTVFYCGSGVTAAHNVLACAVAGKGIPKLYAGSWSDWITDALRPVARD